MKALKDIARTPPSVVSTTSLLMLASILAGHAQTSFTKVTNGPIATDFEQSTGCAWGDYDNDGSLDLFVVNFGANATNTLYHNSGDGTFARFAAGAPVDGSGGGHGCTWGDYDNDGFLDLYVTGLTTINRLYRNYGNGTFERMTEVKAGRIASDGGDSWTVSAAWGDFDRDGNLDLFAANGAFVGSRVDFFYRNLGQGHFTNIAVASNMSQALQSTQGTWADVDGDGRLDLFVTHHGQGNYIYRNLGSGAFLVISNESVLNDRLWSVGSAWGDYDNDGDLDLFVVNRRPLGQPLQTNNFYRNNGSGVFERMTNSSIVTNLGVFNTCAWIDYDNDGYLDLFVVNEGLKNRLYHSSGDGTFLSVTQGNIVTDIANSTGCSWGDYDNDGFLDLFVANGGITSPQRNFLYHNDGNSNHWIKVRCVGTLSNRSAIGAIVRAEAIIDGVVRRQMRQISGGDGWLGQSSLDVSIGFGNATNIDLLRIEWPSGIVQEFQNVAVNQTLIVEEPSRFQSLTAAGEITLKGGGRDAFGRSRRYDIETSADLVGWSLLTSVVVTNADGTATLQDDSPGATNRFYRARRSASE